MKCFSMAPTGGTAFNKFTFANILTFSASQRDWMIRADNNTYWVNPANCTAYSAQYPNWTLSPTLNITPAPFVPGLWRGTTNTDWFECKNWDDITVPLPPRTSGSMKRRPTIAWSVSPQAAMRCVLPCCRPTVVHHGI
ncbi:MAG: hypothetical protein IPJ10_00225 [Flavobacteriales bacterium]|nr:hypothetical protein [Flavobacteriales bacterium]